MIITICFGYEWENYEKVSFVLRIRRGIVTF